MSPLAILAALAIQVTTPTDPASAEAAAVLAPIEATFAALSARDGTRLAPLFEPGTRIMVVIERPDGERVVRSLGTQEFADGLRPGTERFEEVMPDPIVAIDGDVAMVFGRYLFKIDGATVHCGANHFSLIRRDGRWLIASLSWSQRTEGCG